MTFPQEETVGLVTARSNGTGDWPAGESVDLPSCQFIERSRTMLFTTPSAANRMARRDGGPGRDLPGESTGRD